MPFRIGDVVQFVEVANTHASFVSSLEMRADYETRSLGIVQMDSQLGNARVEVLSLRTGTARRYVWHALDLVKLNLSDNEAIELQHDREEDGNTSILDFLRVHEHEVEEGPHLGGVWDNQILTVSPTFVPKKYTLEDIEKFQKTLVPFNEVDYTKPIPVPFYPQLFLEYGTKVEDKFISEGLKRTLEISKFFIPDKAAYTVIFAFPEGFLNGLGYSEQVLKSWIKLIDLEFNTGLSLAIKSDFSHPENTTLILTKKAYLVVIPDYEIVRISYTIGILLRYFFINQYNHIPGLVLNIMNYGGLSFWQSLILVHCYFTECSQYDYNLWYTQIKRNFIKIPDPRTDKKDWIKALLKTNSPTDSLPYVNIKLPYHSVLQTLIATKQFKSLKEWIQGIDSNLEKTDESCAVIGGIEPHWEAQPHRIIGRPADRPPPPNQRLGRRRAGVDPAGLAHPLEPEQAIPPPPPQTPFQILMEQAQRVADQHFRREEERRDDRIRLR